jgi:hypothetical protein
VTRCGARPAVFWSLRARGLARLEGTREARELVIDAWSWINYKPAMADPQGPVHRAFPEIYSSEAGAPVPQFWSIALSQSVFLAVPEKLVFTKNCRLKTGDAQVVAAEA